MATRKTKKEDKRAIDFGFGNSVRNGVVPMANDPDKNERDVPWSLLIAVIVLCFVLIIALPVMGVMYMDMNNATNTAIGEIRKMKELRLQILTEIKD